MGMSVNIAGILGFGLFLAVAVITVIVVVAIVLSRRSDAADKPQEIPLPMQEVPVPDDAAQTEDTAQPLSLGETIKQHRIRCGMTQEYVAETLNVSRQAVSKWETDSSDPSTSNLLALAKLFGISAAELLENIE